MRGTFLIAAIPFVLSGGAAVRPAAAAPIAPPSASSDAAAPALHLVANVCGRNGCAPVQTKKVVHTKPGTVAGKHI